MDALSNFHELLLVLDVCQRGGKFGDHVFQLVVMNCNDGTFALSGQGALALTSDVLAACASADIELWLVAHIRREHHRFRRHGGHFVVEADGVNT